ncbi:phospholipase [Micromonosporaceae bacterium Da 78-11]
MAWVLAATMATVLTATPTTDPAPDRAAVLAAWTQPTAASYRDFTDARQHRADWQSYRFDWSTDHCSHGPERPAGFDFRPACVRHDFGYRNYRAAGTFAANKNRLDRAFYTDLRRRCHTYRPLLRPLCAALAWTYYRAASKFGPA